MIIFLDTKFTDLVVEPQLLSVGMVAVSDATSEFYAEVTDRRRIHAASWFALDAVLPQFGRIAHASCSYATLGARLCAFIERVAVGRGSEEGITVAFSYDLDWELTERAMRDSGGGKHGATTRKLNPQNVYDLVGSGAGKRAESAYFAGEIDASISRHHSLCDARALRIGYEAARKCDLSTASPDAARSAGSRQARATQALRQATS